MCDDLDIAAVALAAFGALMTGLAVRIAAELLGA